MQRPTYGYRLPLGSQEENIRPNNQSQDRMSSGSGSSSSRDRISTNNSASSASRRSSTTYSGLNGVYHRVADAMFRPPSTSLQQRQQQPYRHTQPQSHSSSSRTHSTHSPQVLQQQHRQNQFQSHPSSSRGRSSQRPQHHRQPQNHYSALTYGTQTSDDLHPIGDLSLLPLSSWSTKPIIPDAHFASTNFMLGAGMVIIQPSTGKVVIVYEKKRKYYFLPKGRKDIGESLEQAALREAYEESGYLVEFLPLYMPHRQPSPISNRRLERVTEAIYVTTTYWGPTPRKDAGEYFVHWYVGQIPEDAVRIQGTGMPDEQDYESHLVDVDTAILRLPGVEGAAVEYAYTLWQKTVQRLAKEEQQAAAATAHVDEVQIPTFVNQPHQG